MLCLGLYSSRAVKAKQDNLIDDRRTIQYCNAQRTEFRNRHARYRDLRFGRHNFVDPTRQTGIKVYTVAPEKKVRYIAEKAEAKRGWMYSVCRENEDLDYLFELQHFLSSNVKNETPRVTFEQGDPVNCIIDSCHKSMRSKKWEPIL